MFFSAHGVPKSYVEEAGDPYKEEMEECIDLIMAEMRRRGRSNDHTLAYQSRVGPVEWLQPYTDDSIRCGAAILPCNTAQYLCLRVQIAAKASSWLQCMAAAREVDELET